MARGQEPIPEKIAKIKGSGRSVANAGSDRPVDEGRFAYTAARWIWKPSSRKPSLRTEAWSDLRLDRKNRAQDLIEDFMIAANGVVAQFLEGKGSPVLRRVVRSPKKWDAIREVAAKFHEQLPATADSRSLSAFLTKRRVADPLRFPDLSLTIVKLLGRGEYVVQLPGQQGTGHFGLAVQDYSHSTAPNRRFPDLITQRILKAVLTGGKFPTARPS